MTGHTTLGVARQSPVQAGRLRFTLRAELTAEEAACLLARLQAPLDVNRAGAVDLLRDALRPDPGYVQDWAHHEAPGLRPSGRPRSIEQWAKETDRANAYRHLVHRLFGPLLEVNTEEEAVGQTE